MSSERVYGDPSGWDQAIAHIDMDAFFVACELLRRPRLRGRPVVVGPRGNRGVVAAASYEARRFGVHSALPISIARRRCPRLVVLQPDRGLYRRGSRAVMAVLEEFSDRIEVLGLDEAFVDLSSSPMPKARARELKLRVRERTRLTCSIGIGPNRLVAKIASDLDKPDGLCVLPRERLLEVVGGRPTRILPGVGPRTDERLAAARICTVAELAGASDRQLADALGPRYGPSLRLRACGHGSSEIGVARARKSESRERTFEVDETDERVMVEAIDGMANQVAEHLAAQGISGRTVTLKIRLAPFRTHTRSRTLADPTTDPDLVAATARELFSRFERDAPVRLLGVGVYNLQHPERKQDGAPAAADGREGPAGPGAAQLALG